MLAAPASIESMQNWLEVAEILADGKPAAQCRLITFSIPVTTPLVFDNMNAQLFKTAIQKGFPLSAQTEPIAGTTAPLSFAGGLLMGAVAIGEDHVLKACLFYLLIYTFLNVGAFFILEWHAREGRETEDLKRYAGLAKQHPAIGWALTILVFSLAGLPPTAGFFAKAVLFGSLLESGLTSLVVIALLNSVLALGYYLKILKVICKFHIYNQFFSFSKRIVDYFFCCKIFLS